MGAIRTHTTLPTLFAATATFAVLAAIWSATKPQQLLHGVVTSCGVCFLAGLFGVALRASIVIGLAAIVPVNAYFLALRGLWTAETVVMEHIGQALLFGLCWLTASWWGSYLRYVWSRSRRDLNSASGNEIDQSQPLALHDQMLIRCSHEPVGFLVATLLVCAWIVVILIALSPVGTLD